jgi:uncharacterized protein YheU (UPF0270 family)
MVGLLKKAWGRYNGLAPVCPEPRKCHIGGYVGKVFIEAGERSKIKASKLDKGLRKAMEIPWRRLEADTLRRVIEEFVTREGTDYGQTNYNLEQKVQHVLRQLSCGEAILAFDPDSETCHIVPKRQLSRWNKTAEDPRAQN